MAAAGGQSGAPTRDFFFRVDSRAASARRRRLLDWIVRGIRSMEGGLQLALMRLLPLPSDSPDPRARGPR